MSAASFGAHFGHSNPSGGDLRARRKRLGFTLEEVAKKIDLSGGTISNIENGKPSTYRHDYIKLLVRLEQERLEGDIREHYVFVQSYVAELANRYRGPFEAALAEAPSATPTPLRAL